MRAGLLIAILGVVALTVPGTALADNGNGAATPFTATYSQFGASFTCTGVHIVNANITKDEETCHLAGDLSAFTPGTYVSATPYGNSPVGYMNWYSDYNGVEASSWRINFETGGNAKGTSHIIAYY